MLIFLLEEFWYQTESFTFIVFLEREKKGKNKFSIKNIKLVILWTFNSKTIFHNFYFPLIFLNQRKIYIKMNSLLPKMFDDVYFEA